MKIIIRKPVTFPLSFRNRDIRTFRFGCRCNYFIRLIIHFIRLIIPTPYTHAPCYSYDS